MPVRVTVPSALSGTNGIKDKALIEVGRTDKILTIPNKKQTEDYITGRFG